MGEQAKKKSGGNFRAQSALVQGRNKRLKAEKHAKRMAKQLGKVLKVAKGTARHLRRAVLQATYAKRLAKAA